MSSGGKRKQGGHEEHEEHVNHERWLVSYADMLTLLFVLFVVLFSMSDINKKKFAELAAGLEEGFGSQSAAFTSRGGTLDGSGNNTEIMQIDPGANPGDGTHRHRAPDHGAAAGGRSRRAGAEPVPGVSRTPQAAAKEAENLKKIENKISDALAKEKLLGSVKFTIDRRGLVVTVVTNEVVFDGNRADLQPGGAKILERDRADAGEAAEQHRGRRQHQPAQGHRPPSTRAAGSCPRPAPPPRSATWSGTAWPRTG